MNRRRLYLNCTVGGTLADSWDRSLQLKLNKRKKLEKLAQDGAESIPGSSSPLRSGLLKTRIVRGAPQALSH